MKRFSLAIAAVGLLAAAAMAEPAAKIQSGPQAGSGLPGLAFQVVDITGPNKPKQLCYY